MALMTVVAGARRGQRGSVDCVKEVSSIRGALAGSSVATTAGTCAAFAAEHLRPVHRIRLPDMRRDGRLVERDRDRLVEREWLVGTRGKMDSSL